MIKMIKMIKNCIMAVLLVVLSAIIMYVFISYEKLFGCSEDYFNLLMLAYFFLVPILIYKSIEITYKKLYKPLFFLMVVLGLGFLTIRKTINHYKTIIDNNGGVVIVGVINEKYSYYNTPNNIFVKSNIEGEDRVNQFPISQNLYNILSINDTVTLVYSIICNDWILPHDFTPSPYLIKKCKDGCYYKDGKIVDEL